jgi:hypothetical protein
MKKLLFVAVLATSFLSTTQSLMGMQGGMSNGQIELPSGEFVTPWELHSLVCRLAWTGDIDRFNALLNNTSICSCIELRSVNTALENAVCANHIDIAQAIIRNEITRAKISGCSVISSLHYALKDDKIELDDEIEFVKILLELDLLPIENLKFMLDDNLSDEARALFKQAIQRKTQVL